MLGTVHFIGILNVIHTTFRQLVVTQYRDSYIGLLVWGDVKVSFPSSGCIIIIIIIIITIIIIIIIITIIITIIIIIIIIIIVVWRLKFGYSRMSVK